MEDKIAATLTMKKGEARNAKEQSDVQHDDVHAQRRVPSRLIGVQTLCCQSRIRCGFGSFFIPKLQKELF
jgi:hypothetical protein